jgi:lipoprotein-anchoring transpeptidase ErfK/SrfK
VVVPIKNTGSTSWDGSQLQLGTTYSTGDKNRPSIWQSPDWVSDTRIGLNQPNKLIKPGKIAEFQFTMQVPKFAGQYREYFQPVLGDSWLVGEPIVIQIQVGDGVTVQSVETKEIQIYRASQQTNWLENGYIVATLSVSTGKSGYTTPSGRWRIYNRFEEAYSAKYKLYMGNWLGIAKEGVGFKGYGMHSLAYWKIAKPPYPDGTIKNGRLYVNHRVYEDVLHLGKPMSHGCIRNSIDAARVLYGWAPNNTLVTVI